MLSASVRTGIHNIRLLPLPLLARDRFCRICLSSESSGVAGEEGISSSKEDRKTNSPEEDDQHRLPNPNLCDADHEAEHLHAGKVKSVCLPTVFIPAELQKAIDIVLSSEFSLSLPSPSPTFPIYKQLSSV